MANRLNSQFKYICMSPMDFSDTYRHGMEGRYLSHVLDSFGLVAVSVKFYASVYSSKNSKICALVSNCYKMTL